MKVVIQTGMSELEEIAQFDFVGNLPFSWVDKADELTLAANVLRSQKHDTLWAELMLRAFALENLLKALWLIRADAIFQNGKMENTPKHHNLLKLATELKMSLNEAETSLLSRLYRIAVSIGRYPSATKFADAQGKIEQGGRTVEIFWEQGDNATLETFEERLRKEIGIKIE
jgi:hypothetical protein